MHSDRPELPLEDLRAAAGDHPESNAALTNFHEALSAEPPDPATLSSHAAHILTFPSIVGPFERWWLNPHVQAFIAELNATGI